MSLKMKLISTISAFIMVVSLMLVGILAAGSATLNIGGNVSFTANSVYAQITGSIESTAEHPTGSPLSLSTIDIDYTDTETAIDLSGANSDWTTMPLNFDENASAITITMNIENKATDRAIKITLTDNTSIENVKVVRKYNDKAFEESTNIQTINGGEIARYEFTLSLQSQNNDISDVFNLNVALENSVLTGHTITLTRTGASLNFWGDLQYSVNGDVYKNIIGDGTIQIFNVKTIKFKNGDPTMGGNKYSLSFSPNTYESVTLSYLQETQEYEIIESYTISVRIEAETGSGI